MSRDTSAATRSHHCSISHALLISAAAPMEALPQERTYMDFIFMLTHRDRTIEDPLGVLDGIRPLGLRHIGFKDIGTRRPVIEVLVRRIRDMGALSYLEVVSTEREVCLRSAQMARDLGVDRLLGGTLVDEILSILDGSRTAYFPFTGHPVGHPTRLGGMPADIEAQCRAFAAKGCPGIDLLAYRATDAAPLDLVAAARRGLGEDGYLIAAGSVGTAAQIRDLAAAGADAFTIGTAVFERSFMPGADTIADQIAAILQTCTDAETAASGSGRHGAERIQELAKQDQTSA